MSVEDEIDIQHEAFGVEGAHCVITEREVAGRPPAVLQPRHQHVAQGVRVEEELDVVLGGDGGEVREVGAGEADPGHPPGQPDHLRDGDPAGAQIEEVLRDLAALDIGAVVAGDEGRRHRVLLV